MDDLINARRNSYTCYKFYKILNHLCTCVSIQEPYNMFFRQLCLFWCIVTNEKNVDLCCYNMFVPVKDRYDELFCDSESKCYQDSDFFCENGYGNHALCCECMITCCWTGVHAYDLCYYYRNDKLKWLFAAIVTVISFIVVRVPLIIVSVFLFLSIATILVVLSPFLILLMLIILGICCLSILIYEGIKNDH